MSGDLSTALALMTDPWQLQPNLWWPESRSWCVATEIDLLVTYIGGSQSFVGAIAGDSAFETKRVAPGDTFKQGRDDLR